MSRSIKNTNDREREKEKKERKKEERKYPFGTFLRGTLQLPGKGLSKFSFPVQVWYKLGQSPVDCKDETIIAKVWSKIITFKKIMRSCLRRLEMQSYI